MKLSANTRKAIPSSQLGIPSVRKGGKNQAARGGYPMPDKSHAANAKARAEQAVKAGRMSERQEEKIDAKANRVIRSGGGHPGRDDGGKGRPMTSSAQRARIEARRAHGITTGRRRANT